MNQKVSVATRLASMFIDHAASSFIVTIISFPIMLPGIVQMFRITHEQNDFNVFDGMTMKLLLIPFTLYFLKDSIQGRSIAKRVMKLQVLRNSTDEAAGPIRCLIRNIFCALWPIEVLVTLISPQRRIGDFVAGTKVVSYDVSVPQTKPRVIHILIAFVLAYSLLILAFIPFERFVNQISKVQNVSIAENSLNPELSKEIEKMYADSMGTYLKADARAYDKIKGDTLKYVSVIFYLKENYLEDEGSSKEIQAKTESLLYTKCPKELYKGQLKYVYKSGGSMQMTSHQIGKGSDLFNAQ